MYAQTYKEPDGVLSQKHVSPKTLYGHSCEVILKSHQQLHQ
jgi:hypothetical protein